MGAGLESHLKWLSVSAAVDPVVATQEKVSGERYVIFIMLKLFFSLQYASFSLEIGGPYSEFLITFS